MTTEPHHRTLRDLAGLTDNPTPLAESTLLVIDAQIAYSSRGDLPLPDLDAASTRIRDLLDDARRRGSPVIHVAHLGAAGTPFDPVGGGQFLPVAAPDPGEVVVEKSLPNAFAGTDLLDHVERFGRPLLMCGFMTHMCVTSTARAALDRGWDTNIAADATATRPLRSTITGDVVAASTIQDAALAALADRFSVVAPTSAFLGAASLDAHHGEVA